MAEMVKCEACGAEMERGTKYCVCGVTLPFLGVAKPGPEHRDYLYASIGAPDYLKSIDASVRTIKRIAIWWLVLSIVGLFIGFLAAVGAFH